MEKWGGLLIALIGSEALFTFIQFMITRWDNKKNGIRAVADQIQKLSDKVDNNSAVLARTHILRFSDELSNGVIHSQEYFRQQMDDCDTYDQYCAAHPEFKNSYTVAAETHIKTTYQNLLAKGEFSI